MKKQRIQKLSKKPFKGGGARGPNLSRGAEQVGRTAGYARRWSSQMRSKTNTVTGKHMYIFEGGRHTNACPDAPRIGLRSPTRSVLVLILVQLSLPQENAILW